MAETTILATETITATTTMAKTTHAYKLEQQTTNTNYDKSVAARH